MNRVFKIERSILVPDGTIVCPFLNPSDSTSGLPWELMQGFSLAAGDLPPHSKSKIRIMPLAAQNWQALGLLSSGVSPESRHAALSRRSRRAKPSD